MKSNPDNPDTHLSYQGEMLLSGAALLDLMQAVLARGKIFRFTAYGNSMHPFIKSGDVVSVDAQPPLSPLLGDVVAFIHPASARLIVHRVTGKSNDGGCWLQGDNSPCSGDGLVLAANLLGRVSRVERGGQQVRLGLGPERGLIGLLSRAGVLQRMIRLGAKVKGIGRKLTPPAANGGLHG